MKIQRATIHNMDCMEFMAGCKDNQFDLAILDPPYGIGMGGGLIGKSKKDYKQFAGNDEKIPSEKYFIEVMRVSKNQIIWGGNYMTKYLPPVKSWFIWDKRCGVIPQRTFADCEMAWTSINTPARIFRHIWDGMLQ